MDRDRRSQLLGIKLNALLGDHVGRPVDVEPVAIPDGAALVADGCAWVLVDGPAATTLGPALAWALRRQASSLDLIAEHDTGLLARRAAAFRFPIAVWYAEERALLPAVAEPLRAPPDPSPAHLALVELIERAGAAPNVEHGVVTGEVRGLEVCRVVDEPTLGRLTDEHGVPLAQHVDVVAAGEQDDGAGRGVILEVGVGANDREAFQLLHGHVPKVEALADVVRSVASYRSDDAPGHPLNRMAPERAMRATAIDDPGSIGLVELHPVPAPLMRPSMKETAPCVAVGRDEHGLTTAVVFSAGVDLDLVPFVADTLAMLRDEHGELSVVVVLAARDLVPVTRELVDALDADVSFATV